MISNEESLERSFHKMSNYFTMQSDHPIKQKGEVATTIQILNVNHRTQKLIGLFSNLALINGVIILNQARI
jgi:hypothetical protein